MKNDLSALKMRDLMPDGYLSILIGRTKCMQRSTISGVVLAEQTTSKYWPAIEQLAKETNPEGFARWESAQLQAA
jgi:hypothetical protein